MSATEGEPRDPSRAEESTGAGEPLAQRLDRALVRLARDERLLRADLDEGLAFLARVAADALDVERVGVWFLEDGGETLRCAEQYVRSEDRHASGQELTAEDFPAYFEAIREERQIAAEDVHADPRTRELSEPYARPLGIDALLDSPVWLDGEVAGVVCHEQEGGARRWSRAEKMFAASVADFVTLALEARERRRTQSRLREREERLERLLNALPVGVVVHDRGEIVFANPEVARILGIDDPDDLTGRDVFGFLPEEQRERARSRARGIVESQEPAETVEYEVSRPDGEDRRVEVSGWPVTQRGRTMVQVMVRDVTEQRRAERRLRRSERQLREMLDSAPVPMAVHDRTEFLYANAEFAELVGAPDGDALVGTPVVEVLPEERADEFQEQVSQVLDEGRRVDLEEGGLLGPGDEERIVFGRAIPISYEGREAVQVALRDVTEERRARRRLEESERRYRRLFEENVAGVFRTTVDGRILECNRAFAEIFGFDDPAELRDVPAEELYVAEESRDEYLETLRVEGAVWNYEMKLRRWDGEVLWAMENARLHEDPATGEEVISGTLIDITEQRELREELEEMAYHDPLTDLPNRRLLAEQAATALALADRHDGRVGLVYLDLSRFKRINDTLGHDAGDQVLVESADRLRAALRESDTPARVGGDEFAVLLPDVDDMDDVVDAARRIREHLAAPYRVAGESFRVSCQIGVALYPDHAEDFSGLLSAADQAMYQAKRSTGVQVAASRPESEVVEASDLAREEGLRRAVAGDRVRPHFQPIYRVADRTLEGAEALARWHHPERGVLPAGEFIHLAERTGIVRELDRAMLDEVIGRMASGGPVGGLGLVTVNLSGSTLEDPDLGEFLERRIDRAGIDPARLVLEITEQVGLRRPGRVSEALGRLAELGIRFAVDDFGTGYSSLAYLHRFPTDFLKLDLLYLEETDGTDGREQLMAGMLALGERMGMEVVAEGVERESQLGWLEENGCELMQGFLLSEPVSEEELAVEASGPEGSD